MGCCAEKYVEVCMFYFVLQEAAVPEMEQHPVKRAGSEVKF